MQCTYIYRRQILNLFVLALETGRKVRFWLVFSVHCTVSMQMQINLFCTDNVRILSLSVIVRKSKQLSKR
jgi:hypothetical protein